MELGQKINGGQSMKLKRIATKVEPVAKVHNYIVQLVCGSKTTYKYVRNREEVRAMSKSLKKGQRMLVFSAKHEYEYGWEAI